MNPKKRSVPEHFILHLFWSISLTESREFRTLLFVKKLLFFQILALSNAFAGPVHGPTNNSPSTFEAVTGDSPDEERSVWDSFYKNKANAFGKEAIGFLKEHLHQVKKGRAFVPAMGEGRNAIYLAKHGFKVDGVDLSEVAVDRAVEAARHQKADIKGIVADLTTYQYPNETYDFIVLSLFYMPNLMPKFKKTLKRGGHIMIYVKADNGKPTQQNSPDDFLVKGSDLKTALRDFETISYKEYKDHDVEVVAILARKP